MLPEPLNEYKKLNTLILPLMLPHATCIFSLVCIQLLTVNQAHAQATFSIGPRVGLNLSTFHYPDESAFQNPYLSNQSSYTLSHRSGIEVGLAASIGVEHFAIQPSLLYSQKGYQADFEQGYPDISKGFVSRPFHYTSRFNYLTLPINVVYTHRKNGQGAQVFAGPYIGFLLGGNYEIKDLSANPVPTGRNDVTAGGLNGDDGILHSQSLDIGLQSGLGYRYQNLLVQVSYSLGLRNLAVDYLGYGLPAPVSQPSYYNRAWQVSLCYLFGPKN